MDFYLSTLRLRFQQHEAAILENIQGPRLIVKWHNRSLILPAFARYLRPNHSHAIISASRQAAWEAAYYAHCGLPAIRGSSTRGGGVAVREAIQVLRRGGDVILSPDGPNGPLYTFQRGAAMIARNTGVPIVLLGFNCPNAHRLQTWDHHLVPWPGQIVEVRVKVIPDFDALEASDDAEACTLLRTALLEINQQ
jgi:hypothetical protein